MTVSMSVSEYGQLVLNDKPVAYMPLNKWAHVVWVRKRNGDTICYINGKRVDP